MDELKTLSEILTESNASSDKTAFDLIVKYKKDGKIYDFTLMKELCAHGDLDLLRKVKDTIPINCDLYCHEMLMIAAQNGHLHLLMWFLQSGWVNSHDSIIDSMISGALIGDHFDIADWVITTGHTYMNTSHIISTVCQHRKGDCSDAVGWMKNCPYINYFNCRKCSDLSHVYDP